MAQKLHDEYGYSYDYLKVLLGGWGAWQQNNATDPDGYPIETGAAVDAEATATAEAMSEPEAFARNLMEKTRRVIDSESGDLPANSEFVSSFNTGYTFRNFVAEVTFTNPYAASENDWDYGLLFRQDGAENRCKLFVTSDKKWHLDVFKSTNYLQTGQAPDLGTGAEDTNGIKLVAYEDVGYLFLTTQSKTDYFVSELDLSTCQAEDEISVGAGFILADNIPGTSTSFSNFALDEILDQ
ncbi:MAG: hypothetical protein WCD37_06760 [Chloroflexia bacterium]